MAKSRRCFFQQVLCAAMVLAIPVYCSASSVFNFDSVQFGTPTPFSDTNNGITATFSSTADPGGFEVRGMFLFVTLTGNELMDPGPAAAAFIPLTITFSRNVTSVSLNFATDGEGTFFLDAYNSGSIVGGASTVGSIPPGVFFPEGSISFGTIPGVTFKKIVLTSPSTPLFLQLTT